jgi:hypothetical protein
MADGTTEEAEPPAEKPKYGQAFFLVLALQGKDEWNKWRCEHQDVRVTFAGVDFSESPRDGIDFSGFEFGNNAIFSGCTWRGGRSGFAPGRAIFHRAVFGRAADFSTAVFGNFANFTGAAFGASASFTGAAFGAAANFQGAVLRWSPDFTTAEFGQGANFTRTLFGPQTRFTLATFGDAAEFSGAAFDDEAVFERTNFKGQVGFTGQSPEQWSTQVEAAVKGQVSGDELTRIKDQFEKFCAIRGAGPDRFLRISFFNASFGGEARFSDRSFERMADFTGAHFY